MTELQTKQIDFLNETTAHYTLKNRGYNGDHCEYSPIIGISEGCAIGRKIADKKLCSDLDSGKFDCCFGVSSNSVFAVIPKELQELGQDFLAEIQSLHDDVRYWDETGLNEVGKNKVQSIKKEFDLL